MSKNIMIPEKLFTTLYKCFVIDLERKCDTCCGCAEVKRQLEEKGDKIYRHNLYTKKQDRRCSFGKRDSTAEISGRERNPAGLPLRPDRIPY